MALLTIVAVSLSALPDHAYAVFPSAVDGEPLPSLAPMLERVTPAVVNISTRGPLPRRNPLFDDPFFRRYFGLDDRPETMPAQSLGSGVIVDAGKGLIVTNFHVIDNAAQILVTLSDGREADATLVGSDPEADIALIRIEASGLTQLTWADSSALRVGDFCVAIGNPFGLGQSVTSGIVSALGRSGLGIENYEDFIQTDASINPGNSGGALVNLRGELIGINTAIVGPSGGNVGIGFAIPSDMAADLTEQLLQFGEVRRGDLGIATQALTLELAQAFGIESGAGVIIGSVHQGSPADKAGLRAGDVITAIDGKPVRDVRAMRNRIGLVRLGDQLRLQIIRNKKQQSIDVTVEALPQISSLFSGAALLEQQSQNGRRYVVIETVIPDSIIDRAGLQPGDILLSVNRQGVGTMADIESITRKAGDEILLLVQRGRSTSYVRLPNR
jgi:serine protease Do/serine protease DegQ